MLKPIRLVGACVSIGAMALLIIYWIVFDVREGLNIENRLDNRPFEKVIAEKKYVITDRKTIQIERDNVESVMKGSSLPDELILGMSQSELDAFHKRQMLGIYEQLSNPQTVVELPPSDDIIPPMTLRDLNALHKQQTTASQSKHIEIVLPDGDDINENRDAVTTLDELDLIHKEQSIQARADNQLVELPPVSSENEFHPLTLDQLGKMHSSQQLSADFNQVDDTKPIVLPPSDDGPHTLTNWGLIELHAQQEELIKQ